MTSVKDRKRACVTGGAGFIGRKLVDSLCEEGYLVRILSRGTVAKESFGTVEAIIGDLSAPDFPLTDFLKDCNLLFHCAGEVRNSEMMELVHVRGTSRLIEAAKIESRRSGSAIHIIQLSSCGAYGPPVQGPQEERVVTEDSPILPVSVYEITKAKADGIVVEGCEGEGLTYSILRPSNVIGRNAGNHSLNGIIRLVRSGMFFFLGKSGAISTYVHVDDVVAAMICLSKDERARGEIYNLSSDCSLESLVEEIASRLAVPRPRLRLPAFMVRHPIQAMSFLLRRWINIPKLDALVMRTRYPADKIESELGFAFRKPLPAAVSDLLDA